MSKLNLTLKWNGITSLMCSQVLEKQPVTKLFQALNVLDADAGSVSLLLSEVLWAITPQWHEATTWSKSHAGPWTACFSGVNYAMIRFLKACMVHTTILSENLVRKSFGKYLYKFLVSPICNWFLFWNRGYYKGQICFRKEALPVRIPNKSHE